MAEPDPFGHAGQASNLVVLAESYAEQGDWLSADRLFCEALILDSSDSNRISYGVCLCKTGKILRSHFDLHSRSGWQQPIRD